MQNAAPASSGRLQRGGKDPLQIVVVGAGVGGLVVSGVLAHKLGSRVEVTIIEKNADIGGRLQTIEEGGHRFDTGPSLLLMPQAYRAAFRSMGTQLEDHVQLRRVEPAAYRVFFHDDAAGPSWLDLLYDVQAMAAQLEAVEPGAAAAYLRFLANAKAAFDVGTKNFIEQDFRSFWDYANVPRLLPLLGKVSPIELLGPHAARMATYFKDPRLRALVTFQDLYVGLSPRTAPGVFSLLAATELLDGVWYPLGGFKKVGAGLLEAAKAAGVSVRRGTAVRSIQTSGSSVQGVLLDDGTSIPADVVVANPDLPYVYEHLLDGPENQRKAARLAGLDYSAGVIEFCWCLDQPLPLLSHHSVFLSDEYERSWDRATAAAALPQRPNFYVAAPSRTDPSAAPPGGDSIMVLLPVANLGQMDARDLDGLVAKGRAAVLRRLAEAGCGDVESHIVHETVTDPLDWRERYNLQHGAAFGLAHGLAQLAYFRPDLQDSRIKGLFFTGASTRPGNGVPLVMIGAQLTAQRITEHLSASV
ncbi:phytoene dehydrogenase [Klebsormidium nitens]|uniref:Phytoene dehydrogenase n=1 Tax=Klebsormidium nitens TaxID=105231 RepID=A0A1Y1HYI1_KLENI|nr:phytoene dehydrogenase [Klebsormidium nitens]|eukprot:GAQ81597.1 phytoene dehydrogenase [Klebsormidium nitens]